MYQKNQKTSLQNFNELTPFTPFLFLGSAKVITFFYLPNVFCAFFSLFFNYFFNGLFINRLGLKSFLKLFCGR